MKDKMRSLFGREVTVEGKMQEAQKRLKECRRLTWAVVDAAQNPTRFEHELNLGAAGPVSLNVRLEILQEKVKAIREQLSDAAQRANAQTSTDVETMKQQLELMELQLRLLHGIAQCAKDSQRNKQEFQRLTDLAREVAFELAVHPMNPEVVAELLNKVDNETAFNRYEGERLREVANAQQQFKPIVDAGEAARDQFMQDVRVRRETLFNKFNQNPPLDKNDLKKLRELEDDLKSAQRAYPEDSPQRKECEYALMTAQLMYAHQSVDSKSKTAGEHLGHLRTLIEALVSLDEHMRSGNKNEMQKAYQVVRETFPDSINPMVKTRKDQDKKLSFQYSFAFARLNNVFNQVTYNILWEPGTGEQQGTSIVKDDPFFSQSGNEKSLKQ